MRWTNTLNRIFIFSFSVSSSSLWRKFIRQVWRYDYQPITTNLALWRKVYIRTNCWTLHVYLRHHPTNFLVDSQLVFLERETTAMMLKWWSWTFTFLLDIHWQLVVGGAASLRTFTSTSIYFTRIDFLGRIKANFLAFDSEWMKEELKLNNLHQFNLL